MGFLKACKCQLANWAHYPLRIETREVQHILYGIPLLCCEDVLWCREHTSPDMTWKYGQWVSWRGGGLQPKIYLHQGSVEVSWYLNAKSTSDRVSAHEKNEAVKTWGEPPIQSKHNSTILRKT
jgi:hypothetical protein